MCLPPFYSFTLVSSEDLRQPIFNPLRDIINIISCLCRKGIDEKDFMAWIRFLHTALPIPTEQGKEITAHHPEHEATFVIGSED